jgi:hypothetical protein
MITAESREQVKQRRKDEFGGGKKGGRAMSMASLGPGQIRPIGSWVKYAHALLQTNEAIFIE